MSGASDADGDAASDAAESVTPTFSEVAAERPANLESQH